MTISACTRRTCLAHWPRFHLWPRVFLALGCGERRLPLVHYCASLGPGRDPWRVLWALKVAKSSIRAAQSRAGRWRPLKLCFFCLVLAASVVCGVMSVSHVLFYFAPDHSRGTTTAAHQALYFVTATDGAFVCAAACVYHVSCRRRKCEQTHSYSQGMWNLFGCCAGGGTTIYTHFSSGFDEQPRSQVTYYNGRPGYNRQ